MGEIERLVTVVDLDDRDSSEHSAWAHLYAVLANGDRITLLEDRGWSSSAPITDRSSQEIRATAKMVVGPDEPWGDQTRGQAEEAHWTYLEDKLRDAGVSVQEGTLKTLSHDVEMSDRLRSRLVDSAPS